MDDENSRELVRVDEAGALVEAPVGFEVPAIVGRAKAAGCYADFLIGQFPNPHTRRAYKRHIDRFMAWCDKQGLELPNITPHVVGIYRDRLNGSVATKKQMLAALRRFFDVLVQRHFCLVNPALDHQEPSRGPQGADDEGKTR